MKFGISQLKHVKRLRVGAEFDVKDSAESWVVERIC